MGFFLQLFVDAKFFKSEKIKCRYFLDSSVFLKKNFTLLSD